MGLQDDLQLSTCFSRLEHVLSCDSTQALSMADRGSDSAVFWADHQTAGRGRQGRSWHDTPAQDVAVTFRLVGMRFPHPTFLAAAVPVAVTRALAPLLPEVAIKWPNDLMLGGRKLCGILIDTDGRPPHTYHIGVGVNVNRGSFPRDLQDHSTSIALATGQETDREELVLRLARSIGTVCADLANDEDVPAMEDEFRERLGMIGRRVIARTGDREVTGVLTGVDFEAVVLDGGDRVSLAHLQGLRLR